MRMQPRRAAKRDQNEPEVIAALEAIGCSVHQGGPLDLVVGLRGRTAILEVKAGVPFKLTPSEGDFLNSHRGFAAVVTSGPEAVDVVLQKLIQP